jgi:hypothetical protein
MAASKREQGQFPKMLEAPGNLGNRDLKVTPELLGRGGHIACLCAPGTHYRRINVTKGFPDFVAVNDPSFTFHETRGCEVGR